MRLIYVIIAVTLVLSCNRQKSEVIVTEEQPWGGTALSLPGEKTLSEYGFFRGELKNLEPAEGVIQYELNSPLFTDYAHKKRFIKFPQGTFARYQANDVLDFPEGTVLIKNFYYPADFRKPTENIRILETRLLILENGNWKALPYIWNNEQTEAYLDVAGKNIDVTWTYVDGNVQTVNYSVPNMNQCKGCHLRGDKVSPIGPTARQLNGTIAGQTKNQLVQLAERGLLHHLPPLQEVPRLANYDNKNEPLDLRARAWLEVNCAHCHRPDGPAKTSGLHLLAHVNNPFVLGVGKPPVAAGRGSGGLNYDIVPGKPEQSILYYRINSVDPGIMMPELGKKMIHREGVELIHEWISTMK
ncbi:MAG: SO2930 family diheme c-type cytochrome [Cyclobacteriaceae bacterium]